MGPSKADIAHLRKITARYRDIENACRDGFDLGIDGTVMGCVSHPTLGAMGYHYGNQARFDDPSIKEFAPEALVYYVAADGKLRLGAVEWVVPKAAWEAVHGPDAPPPKVFGKELTILNPALNWYVAHAWIWKDNPSGIMFDWSPDVTCSREPTHPVPTCDCKRR